MLDTDNQGGTGILARVFRLSHHVIGALSPQFLTLIIINAIFVIVFVWFIDKRAQYSMTIMQQLLDTCLQQGSR